MNKSLNIETNLSGLKARLLYLPIVLLFGIGVFLGSIGALTREAYPQVQKGLFLYINSTLAPYPNLLQNITQLGDALVFLSILSVLFVFAPKIWESLLSASIISAIFAAPLKKIFLIPRPAAVFGADTFNIIGRTLTGNNSFPSGHSITVFSILAVLLFAFMPKRVLHKYIWCFTVVLAGIFIVLSRIGVGAHYPIDVAVGSILGYISGVLGILVNQKYNIWFWIRNKKFFPFFIVLFCVCAVFLFNNMLNKGLIIYYLSFICIIFSIYELVSKYFQKQH